MTAPHALDELNTVTVGRFVTEVATIKRGRNKFSSLRGLQPRELFDAIVAGGGEF
jgi:hypothetical protein